MSESRICTVDPLHLNNELLKKAAGILKSGGLVAFPTETVYGLGANALDPAAVEKIFGAKGRPQDNPLIVHVASVAQAKELCFFNETAEKLASSFWPGALTLVLKSRECVPAKTRGGLDSVAVRIPSHPIALALITQSGLAIAAPSANSSGRPSPTRAETVYQDLGDRVDLILDGGSCLIGVESTVLDVTSAQAILLRPGGISLEQIQDCIGPIRLAANASEAQKSPGMRYRHYAPKIPLLLWKGEEAAFPKQPSGKRCAYMGLHDAPCSVDEKRLFSSINAYANHLYECLRELESASVDVIIAELPPADGIGRALIDRLQRASGQ